MLQLGSGPHGADVALHAQLAGDAAYAGRQLPGAVVFQTRIRAISYLKIYLHTYTLSKNYFEKIII
jgi:hypothetical protein